MNEDTFNMEVRKFLKVVGVTSQREIGLAVRKAIDSGKLKDNATLDAKVCSLSQASGSSIKLTARSRLGDRVEFIAENGGGPGVRLAKKPKRKD